MVLPITQLTEDFSVAPQLSPEDIDQVAKEGFRTILILRPDSEVRTELSSQNIADEAFERGISTLYMPIYDDPDKPLPSHESFNVALKHLPRPILAYCRTGMRAVRLYYQKEILL